MVINLAEDDVVEAGFAGDRRPRAAFSSPRARGRDRDRDHLDERLADALRDAYRRLGVASRTQPLLVAVAGEDDDLRGRLAELDVDASAGAVLPALDGFATLKGEALDLGYRPLLAEIDLHVGRVALDAQEWGRAAEALRDAFIHATATGADAIAAEAKARQLFVDGQRDPTAALAEQRHAEALVERLDGRDDLRALLNNNLGAVAAMTGDLDGARAKIRAAIGLAGDDPRIRPVDLASGYLLNLALLTNDAAERAELFDRALTILDDALGPNHPAPAFARLRAGRLAGDPERAAALLAPTCAGLLDPSAANTYELCFLCHHRLGHALVELDRVGEAAASASAGLTCFDRPIAAEDREPVAAWKALLRGRQQLYAGDLEAAGASFAAAREMMEPHREAWWIALLLADVELADGRRLVAAGAPVAARPHLEAAIETFAAIGDQALDDL
ncbi:MAG: hypothetical protein KC486_31405, partial [Myxococcales bacterium]|nr:hypothetical protein [Myxococcales bacterium]